MSHETHKVLVVDDEPPARDRLHRLLGEIENFCSVGEASHGLAALEQVEELKPQIVLMDIRMPGMDGIEAARHISTIENAPAVIFTTAFNEYAIDAFDAQAIGYLMKPVRREKLERALQLATRLNSQQVQALASEDATVNRRTHLSARVGEKLRLIPWDDILYFQADQKYVAVGTASEEFLIDDSLKALENEFDELIFRVHRNALVVLKHLRAIEKQSDGHYDALINTTDKRLAISRRHVSPLRKLIKSQR